MKTILLFGPTAVGKTKLAIELAKDLKTEIISADSMQVYRGMDIGTAKPTMAERQGILHHLIDIRNPDEVWTVSDFVRESQNSKDKIQIAGKLPIIVGGTGLYLWTLVNGYSFPMASADKELRERLESVPLSTLYAQLSTVDPLAAAKIHPNDKNRIVRALEVFELTGKPISELQKKRVADSPHLSVGNSQYIFLGLDLPRTELYARIDQRVDLMINQGLIEEVQGLLAKGYNKKLPAFQALGYKEVISYLDGQWDKKTMVKELKKRTRNFARRQLTWFRRFADVHWTPPTIDIGPVLDYIRKYA